MITSGAIQLAATVDEGAGPAVVLLHGLAGYREEWAVTAEWLRAAGYRVAAYDARGHGDSTSRPDDVSREANVADAAAVLRAVGGGPHVLMGQSLGGHTALLTAAQHPELVSAVVLLEAGPGEAEPSDRIATWLASWPTPFAERPERPERPSDPSDPSDPSELERPERAEAVEFFGGGSVGEAWVAGLTTDANGRLVPRFDPDVIVGTIGAHAGRPYWQQWQAIVAPTLVVLGEGGYISPAEEREMRRLRPDAEIVRLPKLGHDLHLEDPAAVRQVVLPWLHQNTAT